MKTIKLLLAQFLFFISLLSAQNNSFLYFSNEQVNYVKSLIENNDDRVKSYADALRNMADSSMTKGPWSITYVLTKAISGNPHDFFSEGPYWWPDPENPNGPYLRKDGLRNPNRFTAHDGMIGAMTETVSILSYAAYLFDEEKYAKRAAYLLNVWFVDEETNMNPHLEYAQAIRNITDGRGIGIIETHGFTKLIEALNFLKQSGCWKEKDHNNVKKWFGDFTLWLTKSKNGLEEKFHGNNHSSWWAAQVLAYAIFSGQNDIINDIWEHTKEFLIKTQIAEKGNFPLEDTRTRSLHYSVFNLDALTTICRIGDFYDQNLWEVKSAEGADIKKSVNYLLPFIEKPELWDKPELSTEKIYNPLFLALAGFSQNNDDYISLYNSLTNKTNPDTANSFLIVLNMIAAVN